MKRLLGIAMLFTSGIASAYRLDGTITTQIPYNPNNITSSVIVTDQPKHVIHNYADFIRYVLQDPEHNTVNYSGSETQKSFRHYRVYHSWQ